MTLCKEIECFMKNQNLKQYEFAKSIGLSVGYANAIINGKVSPSAAVRDKILRVCGRGKLEKCSYHKNCCYGCFYRRPMTGLGKTIYCCHYMIDTGLQRGMTPQECYKHEGTPYIKKEKGMTARKGVDLPVRWE